MFFTCEMTCFFSSNVVVYTFVYLQSLTFSSPTLVIEGCRMTVFRPLRWNQKGNQTINSFYILGDRLYETQTDCPMDRPQIALSVLWITKLKSHPQNREVHPLQCYLVNKIKFCNSKRRWRYSLTKHYGLYSYAEFTFVEGNFRVSWSFY